MRKRMTRRVAKKESEEVRIAKQLVKMAKTLLAEDEEQAVEEEPQFKELKMAIKGKLSGFNNRGILNKKLQSLKGLTVSNTTVKNMKVMEVFEILNDILSM